MGKIPQRTSENREMLPRIKLNDATVLSHHSLIALVTALLRNGAIPLRLGMVAGAGRRSLFTVWSNIEHFSLT